MTDRRFDSVGDLADFLATLDREMPLTQWGSGGMFERGVEPQVMKLRKMKGHPQYAFGADDTVMKKRMDGDAFDALVF